MLSERELMKLDVIKRHRNDQSLVFKAKAYDADIDWLIQIINRLDTLETINTKDKLELADLRRLKKSVIKFADEVGLSSPMMD